MKNPSYFGRKLEPLFNLHVLSFQFNPFLIQLCYFIILSLFGYLGLKLSNPRTPFKPKNVDLFYTSVSASTVSSMTSIEMEAFSNFQLILITFLMFVGGEVFTSLLGLLFSRLNFTPNNKCHNISTTQIELDLVSIENHRHKDNHSIIDVPNNNDRDYKLKYNSLRCLSHVVLGYLMVVHFIGISMVSLYITYIPSARHVLRNKNINIETFSLFTIVSTFASCGYVPTNENMIVFKKNSGLLLLILPHLLLGNTLYPSCLRVVINVLKKFTRKEEFSFLLKNFKEMGYDHLMSGLHCWFLMVTVFVFNVIQFVLFCSLEWNSKNLEGLSHYQKIVASLFQVTNARHAGESVFDLSTISSAILVLFVVMM